MNSRTAIFRPKLICAQSRQPEHVRGNRYVGECEFCADNPRTEIEDLFKEVEQAFDGRACLSEFGLSNFAAHPASVNVAIEPCRSTLSLLNKFLLSPPVSELGEDIFHEGQLHDRIETRFALANELAHARRLQRIVRNKLWPLESGVDVFIDNRGFAYRLSVVHQSRHDTVWIQGEVLRLHLIELEEVDIAAAPFDSFLFQRQSASHRTYLTAFFILAMMPLGVVIANEWGGARHC